MIFSNMLLLLVVDILLTSCIISINRGENMKEQILIFLVTVFILSGGSALGMFIGKLLECIL